MRLSSLSIKNFRNYAERGVSFNPDLTLIVGPNGSGKTNILEAIYLLATGRSFRTDDVGEMVRFGEEVAHIDAEVSREGDSATTVSWVGRRPISGLDETPARGLKAPLEFDAHGVSVPSKQDSRIADTRFHIALTRGVLQGKRVAKVKYATDGVAKRKADVVGRLKAVLFEPQSLMIVIGDPTYRRAFLDECFTQTDPEYARSLAIYAKALRVRNKLLDAIREGKARRETLEFWEREMVKHGEKLQEMRRVMVEWMSARGGSAFGRNGQMVKTASKGPSLQGRSFFDLRYEPSVISEERLAQYREREIAAGFSLIGPQRDELQIQMVKRLNGQTVQNHSKFSSFSHSAIQPFSHSTPLSAFGSRGEQRMAVLRLKLAEAEWIEKETGESPVLLLDDIYSELDDEHDRMVEELVRGRQAIITATEMPGGHPTSDQIIRL